MKALLRSSRKYTVLLGGRSIDKAQNAARQVASEAVSQDAVFPFQIDVEDDFSIEKAAETIASQFPRIDVVVNNAGMLHSSSLDFTALTEFLAFRSQL